MTIAIVNELADKMRILYRALLLPLEWPKLLEAAKKEQERSKGELEARLHGWTVKQEYFDAGYLRLNELALKVVTHYRDILRHVTVSDMAGGHTHTCALTIPGACEPRASRSWLLLLTVSGAAGELWTFGDPADGKVGHGINKDGSPQLVPRVVMLARPADERELVGGIRLNVLNISSHHKCDAGRVAENVRTGAYVVWNNVMIPPEATVLRVRVWSDQRGAIMFRENGLDGRIVAQIVVVPTSGKWTTMQAMVRRHEDRSVVSQLFAIFNSDNACRLEWAEFVSPAPGSSLPDRGPVV